MFYQPFTELRENTSHQMASRKPPATSTCFSPPGFPSSTLQLQRMLGNQRVGELIQATRLTPKGEMIDLQPKLTASTADDQYEREANQVAREVINAPAPVLSNSTQQLVSSEENKVQRRQTKSPAPPITPFVQRQLDPHKIYCALHAAVCLGLSENPPAAALCWANFAARCGGAMASAGQTENNETMASSTVAPSESEV
jgi:hypothetical protein